MFSGNLGWEMYLGGGEPFTVPQPFMSHRRLPLPSSSSGPFPFPFLLASRPNLPTLGTPQLASPRNPLLPPTLWSEVIPQPSGSLAGLPSPYSSFSRVTKAPTTNFPLEAPASLTEPPPELRDVHGSQSQPAVGGSTTPAKPSSQDLGSEDEDSDDHESEGGDQDDETPGIEDVWRKKRKILRALSRHQESGTTIPPGPPLTQSLDRLKTLVNCPPPKRRRRQSPKPNPPKTHGSRNFVCFVAGCQKRFRRHEHLLRHELIHSGEKPFVCLMCGVSFNRSDVLAQHEKTQKHLELALLRGLQHKALSLHDVTQILGPDP